MRGTIEALQIAEEMGWIPPAVALIHMRLAKSGVGGGAKFQIYLFPWVPRAATTRGCGGTGWEALGGTHVPIVVRFVPGQ